MLYIQFTVFINFAHPGNECPFWDFVWSGVTMICQQWNTTQTCCCCCLVAQSGPTLYNPVECRTPGFPVPHHLPQFAQIHVHWIGDSIQPSRPLSSPSPPTVIFILFMGFSRPECWSGLLFPSLRILEWVAMPFSRGSSQPRDQTQVSRIAGRFFTVWATREAHRYWSGWPIPSAGALSDPGIKPGSPALQADSLPAELPAGTIQT